MADNIQVHYLRRLESAIEYALHGDVEMCLNICFELRLRSDLAFYTRALVNLTLVDFTKIEDCPDKVEFAKEALRLVTELQEEDNPNKDAYWIAEYSRVESEAREAIERATAEDREYELRLQHNRASLEVRMAGLSSTTDGVSEDSVGNGLKVVWLEHEHEESDTYEAGQDVEGLFCQILKADVNKSSPATGDDEAIESTEDNDSMAPF